MKQVLLLIAFIFSAVSITAQNDERQFIDIVKKDNMYVVMVNDGVYIFRFYSSEIVETIFRPSWDKNPYDTISYAVFSKPKFSNYEVTERAEDILIKTKDIYISITKSPFQISYYYKDKLITSEKRGYFKSPHVPMDMVKGNIVADETEKIEFNYRG